MPHRNSAVLAVAPATEPAEKVRQNALSKQLASRLDDRPESVLNDPVIVADYWNEAPYFDEPKLWQISVILASSDGGDDQAEATHAGGAGVTKSDAVWKAAGEAVERWSLLPSQADCFAQATWSELSDAAFDPNCVVAGRMRLAPERRHLRLSWVQAVDNLERTRYIPAQLILVPFLFPENETILRSPITTGAAAALDENEAKRRGLLEIIERDAFMLWWLRQWELGLLDSGEVASLSPTLSFLVEEFQRYRFEPHFLVLYTDAPAVIVACVLEDQSSYPKVRFTVGARAALRIEDACRDSLLEAYQLRCWVRSLPQHFTTPETLEGRARYLRSNVAETSIERALKKVHVISVQSIADMTTVFSLANFARVTGADVFFVDLTSRLPQKTCDAGWISVKAVVPTFQPLYLTESLQDIAWERIQRIERMLGLTSSYDAQSVNRIPHPFL